MRGDRFSRSSLMGIITEAQGLGDSDIVYEHSNNGRSAGLFRRAILTEGQRRVKRMMATDRMFDEDQVICRMPRR
jgi:hypothetical protein